MDEPQIVTQAIVTVDQMEDMEARINAQITGIGRSLGDLQTQVNGALSTINGTLSAHDGAIVEHAAALAGLSSADPAPAAPDPMPDGGLIARLEARIARAAEATTLHGLITALKE